ncbi:kinase [Thraustotheca clavata]|uniref:Kinase n=1 Tax=Thraustotheca clavata TaxID=74557 RepID=A0A1V9Z785_9STRA|nr:kinase [Thraustotheca clavata]
MKVCILSKFNAAEANIHTEWYMMEAKLAVWLEKKEEMKRKKQDEALKKQNSRGKQVIRPTTTSMHNTQPNKGIKRPAPSSTSDKLLQKAKILDLSIEESTANKLKDAKSTIDRILSEEEAQLLNPTEITNASECSLPKKLELSSPPSESNLTEECLNFGFSSSSSSARSSLISYTGITPVEAKQPARISRRVSMPHQRTTTPNNLSHRRASVSSLQPPSSLGGPQRVLATEQHSESEDDCTDQSLTLQPSNEAITSHIARRRSLIYKDRYRRSSTSNQEVGPACSSGGWTKEDFNFSDKKLGYGKFGYVYLAQQRSPPHAEVAMKVSTKLSCDDADLLSIKVESSIQSRLRHPNILRFYGWFQHERLLYFILEYAPGGSLRELLSKQPQKCFTENEAATYIYQLILALQYLHGLHIMHRDIKPENILLGRDGQVKLADFGLASHAPPPYNHRRTYCGTPEYMSPEIFCDESYTHSTDLWSMGILAYELLLGSTPFHGDAIQIEDQFKAWYVSRSRSFPILEKASHLSELAKDFIHGLLQPIELRRSLKKTLEHAWLCRPTV